MQFFKTHFLWLYALLVLFDLLCGFEIASDFRIVSKPLLLLSLFIYFSSKAKVNKNKTFYLVLGALFCSLLGDILLLFDTDSNLVFTLGIASFLVAHILYTLTFIKKWNENSPKYGWLITVFLSLYGGILFYVLQDHVGALRLPVILYILAILAMVVTAHRRKGNVPKVSFNFVFVGALFFVLSDSLLAINKFMVLIPYSHLLVMGTYATAQYLIVKGILTQGEFED